MDLAEHTRQLFESLADHPQRLIASAMGVFWGAAAIVFMLSFGSGFREYMITEMSRYGEGIVFMFPASTSSGFPGYRKSVRVRLARDDVAAIARAHPGLIEVALAEHLSETKVLVEGGGHVRRLDMVGSGHRFVDYRNFEIGWGRSFTDREVDRRSAVALLGLTSATTATDGRLRSPWPSQRSAALNPRSGAPASLKRPTPTRSDAPRKR